MIAKWGFTEVTKATRVWASLCWLSFSHRKAALARRHVSSIQKNMETPKACCLVSGLKCHILGILLEPAPPGPLPGYMGLERVRER